MWRSSFVINLIKLILNNNNRLIIIIIIKKAYTDISSACSGYGGWNQANCRCIVTHESGGNYHACGQNSGETYPGGYKYDVGLYNFNI
jgi:hypothetical protein